MKTKHTLEQVWGISRVGVGLVMLVGYHDFRCDGTICVHSSGA